MLKDLLTTDVKIPNLENFSPKDSQWVNLQMLQNTSITFKNSVHPDLGYCFEIEEKVADGGFHMFRSKINGYRTTVQDTYGLLGLSQINPLDDRVILTEGVSDYFTAKLLEPTSNVLGVTTLSGSNDAKKILLSLFNKFVICADNDSFADKNTGINNAMNFKRFLTSYGKAVTIFTPAPGFKDISENLMFNLSMLKANE